ncbi:MAG TPA: serine hydrolase [Bacteroidia bacterium]|jgi:CubicO group peptidase (beta-lactamase class C family)|nr:serine hydrolase [Bacteroidia bacterium]
MKLKKTLILLALSSSLLAALVGCKNRYLIKGMGDTYFKFRGTPSISGYKIFHNGIVNIGTPQPWPISKNYGKGTMLQDYATYFAKNETAAYLIIKNDSICYEKYFGGFSDTSHTNSWSMAKSVVSLLVGAAIKDGKIKSVDEKVSDFIPSYNKGLDTLLTIKDLLTMSSGILFKENYGDPFGYAAKALYGNNLLWLTHKHHCIEKPGSKFFYQSGNTVLLGEIVTKATGKTLSDYASEKLWAPMGAERPAYWSLDHKGGMEKSFCCFYSNARDFARIGKLMLDSGKWNGQEIIPSNYFAEATKAQTSPDYGYQWWFEQVGKHRVIAAEGFSGQYILIIPDENMVVVRLGKKNASADVSMYAGLALSLYGK